MVFVDSDRRFRLCPTPGQIIAIYQRAAAAAKAEGKLRPSRKDISVEVSAEIVAELGRLTSGALRPTYNLTHRQQTMFRKLIKELTRILPPRAHR